MKNREKINKIKIFKVRKIRKINKNKKIIINEIVNVKGL